MLRPVSVAYDMRKNMFLSWFALVFACPFDSEYCLPTLSQMPARERERERDRERGSKRRFVPKLRKSHTLLPARQEDPHKHNNIFWGMHASQTAFSRGFLG